MKYFIYFGLSLVLIFNTFTIAAQDIIVIFIQGDVKSSTAASQYKKVTSLPYGPVALDQKIIIPKNGVVKLIKEDGFHCEVTEQGSFLVKELEFEKTEEKSTLNSFVNYFKSFFVAHPSSESKEYYKNSIFAISRGELTNPILEFPFSGPLPLINEELNFSWGIQCDTCFYKLLIQDFESKEIVFKKETNKHQYKLKNPEKLLSLNKKYFWSVEIKNTDIKSEYQSFTVSSPKEFDTKISKLEKSFRKNNPYISTTSQMISVFCALEEENLINYMILYGQEQMSLEPENKSLKDFYNRVFYDQIMHHK
ncbi:MAG: hypothetical protein IPO86_03065 [Saprospiraceae bacterium]|nr:hypothetical protein [Saprospiraceae bacterium]MBK9727079.1 hypothetical protein [Saprospiraceae bacterium]